MRLAACPAARQQRLRARQQRSAVSDCAHAARGATREQDAFTPHVCRTAAHPRRERHVTPAARHSAPAGQQRRGARSPGAGSGRSQTGMSSGGSGAREVEGDARVRRHQAASARAHAADATHTRNSTRTRCAGARQEVPCLFVDMVEAVARALRAPPPPFVCTLFVPRRRLRRGARRQQAAQLRARQREGRRPRACASGSRAPSPPPPSAPLHDAPSLLGSASAARSTFLNSVSTG
jgi:hypothetical protein